MLDLNYFSGKIEDRVAAQEQLVRLSRRRNVAIIGAFGRAIMYQTFGYTPAAPLAVRLSPGKTGLRPIEAFYIGHAKDDPRGPHEVNFDASLNFFDLGLSVDRPALWAESTTGSRKLPVDPAVVEPVTRGVAPHKLKTLRIGTHLLLERMLAASHVPENPDAGVVHPEAFPETYQEHRDGLAEFTAFADSMREDHPGEFNTAEQEAPFETVIRNLTVYREVSVTSD